MAAVKIKDFSYLAVFFQLFVIYCRATAETEFLSSSGSIPLCDVTADDDDDPDVDITNLAECQQKWRELLYSYVKALRKDRTFNICGQYKELRDCLQSYSTLCRQYGGNSRQNWLAVSDHLELVCTNRSKHHMDSHECFEEEMRGVLASRCDEYHKFNVQQHTRHECHFLLEAIHCRVNLVSSACGASAEAFAFDLLKFTNDKLAQKLKCHITKEHNFKMFRYSHGCRRSFLEEIEKCATRHLTEDSVAEFHTENDLVSVETERDFKSACRAYRKFTSCLEPINETCSDGVTMFLDYEASLRRYMLKMSHVCHDDVINVYGSSLECYQSVLSNGQLGQCNVHWANLRPWLSNMTAYKFFCDASNVNTVNLLLEIQKSHMCHTHVFASECGQNASRIMADLMDRALKDPLYLRLGFRPDCRLHNGSSGGDPHQPVSLPTDGIDSNNEEDIYVSSASLSTSPPSLYDKTSSERFTKIIMPYITSSRVPFEPTKTNSATWRMEATSFVLVPAICLLLFR